jgi:RNA polymerase sigma-70 factor (ECF subfamily)
MMRICYRYVHQKSDAEPLLNQAFCKVLIKIDQYDDIYPFGAWVKRITINTIIDEFRKNTKYEESERVGSMKPYDELIAFDPQQQKYDAEELMHMVQMLPPMSREIFNLHCIDGYMHKEIAEMLNIGLSASKWHVANARGILKRQLLEKTEKKSSERSQVG